MTMPPSFDHSEIDRTETLAQAAELYYLQNLNQNQIARKLGVDRSTVSRMLAEARRLKIVEVRIHHPLVQVSELETALTHSYRLIEAIVVKDLSDDPGMLLPRLGSAAAGYIQSVLSPNSIFGLSWGTAISAVVDAIEAKPDLPIKVVQLVGALGAQNSVYDGHGLVQRLAAKFNSKAYYLNAPFLVNDQAVAQALEDTPSIRSVIELGEACDLALLGIGSLKAANSSFLQAGYVSLEDFEKLKEHRMVGDICGRHFTITGEILDIEFHHRIIAITPQALKNIPLRIAVAGGPHKAIPILGALRSGLLNVLVTNESTAQQIVNYS
jgi:deoxyribonucleoside regulator